MIQIAHVLRRDNRKHSSSRSYHNATLEPTTHKVAKVNDFPIIHTYCSDFGTLVPP